jgi:hypothetical protein
MSNLALRDEPDAAAARHNTGLRAALRHARYILSGTPSPALPSGCSS